MSLLGIDVGSYQAGLDFAAARAQGIEFCVVKIGQGAGNGDHGAHYGASLNSLAGRQLIAARTAGMIVAGYWYLGNAEAPASQAARCKAALGDPALPLALDWEDAGGSWSTFTAVLAAFRAAGLNVRLAYCPRWYAEAHGMPPSGLHDTGLALWSSRYPSSTRGAPGALLRAVPAEYWAGYGGADVTVLQYAESGVIGGVTVDCDAYAGTRSQLAALLTGSNPAGTREDDMAIQSGSWPAAPGGERQTLACPVGPGFMYGSGYLSLGVGWADASYRVTFVGAVKPDGTRTYLAGSTPAGQTLALPYDKRVPIPIPAGTELISVEYTSGTPLGWSLELKPS